MINSNSVKSKILIVEDELIVAQNIQNQLIKLGYDVPDMADSGDEAIAMAEKHKPNLVLMDIKLSGEMDGIQAATEIRNRFHIPVVYLTAFVDNETLQRAKVTDPFGYVLKPFELRNLHSTIEIALYKNVMEQQIKDSELRFRTLAEFSPVGIFQTDIKGDCIYVNKVWCDIAGISVEQAAGKGWVSALHPEDRELVADAWYRMTQSGGHFEMEYRFLTPSGKVTWVFGRAVELNSQSDKKIGYIGTLTDITIRKKLEDELLNSKKLESIGILAGGLAHDFNNLLSVLLGNISILKDDSNLTREQHVMIENMEKATSQASELAQKLITFSKGGWLNRKKIDFDSLINEVIHPQFSNINPPLNIQIPGDLFQLDGDKPQLKQVFTNLILNAVEAGNENNQISISAQNMEIPSTETGQSLKPGRYVKISINDTGVGIAKEDLEKIFDPYFSTKEKGPRKGLGLGMSICYSVLQKHGGHIEVKSAKCCGTTVDVYIPAYTEPVPAVESLPSQPLSKIRTLVMDDEPIVLDVTSKMLERLGFDVSVFEEGQAALVAFKQAINENNPYRIVLLDIVNKSGLGGKETLRIIYQLDPNTRAIALSGYSDDFEIDRLKAEGFDDVLIKPYKLGDLKIVMDKIVLG